MKLPASAHAQTFDTVIDAESVLHGESKPANPPRILLVEDYQANVLVATTYLESFGYECEVASNGIEAIAKIKQYNFDAVLMDVEMYEMDGLSATKAIREYEMNAKHRNYIIGMTAHAMAGDKEKCIAAGMDDYISKPFQPDNLQKKLALAIQPGA